MALGRCELCKLPGIVADLQSLRVTAEIASANATASEAVTENNPYLKAKNEALTALGEKQKEYADFVNEWRGVCLPVKKCEYGA